MYVKTLIGCAILTPILFAGPVLGQEADGKTIANTGTELLAFDLPGVEIGRRAAANRPVELAQAAEPQINDLQEQIRRLNGKVDVPPPNMVSSAAWASARVAAITTPLPAASPSALITTGRPKSRASAASASARVVQRR